MKIKLIKMPFIGDLDNGYDFNASSILPLSIGILAASLRTNKFLVDIDDLDIKTQRDKNLNLKIFLDLYRCMNYINGKPDIQLEKVIEKILNKTQMQGYSIFLLSFGTITYPGSKGIFLSFNYYIKKKFGKIMVAGGLEKIDFEILDILKNKDILDYLITGYGENSIVSLLRSIRDKNTMDNIDGLIYAKGKIIQNEINKPQKMRVSYNINLKPDFEGLPLDLYKRKIREKELFILPLIINEGCAFSCAFCIESSRSKKDIKINDPKTAVKFIKKLKEKYKTPYFAFLDSTFNASKKFVEEFCSEIINSNLKIFWNDSARLDRHIFTDNNIKLMKEAGCVQLIYGLESASQGRLNYIEKGVTLKNASLLLKKTSEAGIWNTINLISGLPYESEKDIDNTIIFINNHKDFIDECAVMPFYLKKNSSFYINPDKYGLENIHKLSKEVKSDNKKLYFKNFDYSFDEKFGSKWPEKLKQIKRSFIKIKSNINIPSIVPPYNHLPILFYLYSRYDDKNEIKKEYFKIKKRILFNLIIKPGFVYNHIKSNLSTPDLNLKMLVRKLRIKNYSI